MAKHYQKKRRRREMWEQDPHCHWCGRETVLPHKLKGGTSQPNQATLDHLFNRLDLGRYQHKHGDVKYVLSCYECNWRRGLEAQKQAQVEGNPKAFRPRHNPLPFTSAAAPVSN